ncbi:MAG: VCBS repeat-containing protein [Acidiferrobacterales bacterium]|nr:VCBS repeat-containing protein [Acidiferrobacterales bacterium]
MATEITVADTPSQAITKSGDFISWNEHIIDDEQVNGGIPIRGGDGIAMADLNRDGFLDFVTAQEDSNHLRIAYGSNDPQKWELKTIAEGDIVGAVEDVALGDLNGDGWVDIVAACEESHIAYFQNPATHNTDKSWDSIIPSLTKNRGSWIRAFTADVTGDGQLDITAANKGASDIVRPGIDAPKNGPTSLITLSGPPLKDSSWHEQILFQEGVPNTALPVDIDGDGDIDILAAKRVQQELVLIENLKTASDGTISSKPIRINITPSFPAPTDWKGFANAFQADIADIDGDNRLDIVLNVIEKSKDYKTLHAGLGWLKQPEDLSSPWLYYRIGNTLPDWVIGIHLADIDGDSDLDVVTGGYSGLNILDKTYSGASRDFDDPSVTSASSVARLAWFENTGNAKWIRHDISRRVRGMYDMFISHDMDNDGDLDIVAPRGNSGSFDGVFWLEQIRSKKPRRAFTPSRETDSRHLPLPPENWQDIYDRAKSYIAPNKKGSSEHHK